MWVTSSSPIAIRPVSGSTKPAIIRSVVVLPQPDGPSSTTNSPCAIVRLTSSTTRTPPYDLQTPSTETLAIAPQRVIPRLQSSRHWCVSSFSQSIWNMLSSPASLRIISELFTGSFAKVSRAAGFSGNVPVALPCAP